MALNFKRTETFAVTVHVEMPSEDEKKPLKGSFVAKFRHLNRAQMTSLQEDLKDGRLTDELFLDGYLVGVSGIVGIVAYPIATVLPKMAPAAVRDAIKKWIGGGQ